MMPDRTAERRIGEPAETLTIFPNPVPEDLEGACRDKPLRAVIIAANETKARLLAKTLTAVESFLPVSLYHGSISIESLDRILEDERAAIVFLDFEDLRTGLLLNQEIKRLDKGIVVVAFSTSITKNRLLHLMREAVHHWIPLACPSSELHEVLGRVGEEIKMRPPRFAREGRIVSILPAKQGGGASTVAAHAAALAAKALGKRVALFDLDLTCGVQGFLHGLDASMPMNEVAQYSESMDDVLWQKLVGRAGEVDVLRAGAPIIGRQVDPAAIQRLLDFAEARYPLVLVDLSGHWEQFAVAAMQRSTAILLVAASDMVSIHIARQQLLLLSSIDASARTKVVVNRCVKLDLMSDAVIKEMLGVSSLARLPNCFVALQRALRAGKLLSIDTPFQESMWKVVSHICPYLPAENRPVSSPGWSGAGFRAAAKSISSLIASTNSRLRRNETIPSP